MTLPFTLPDWVPPWVGFVILVLAVLFALAFALMPFSVFGVKGRLDTIEARLDELQQEIRALTLRLPEPSRYEYTPDPPLSSESQWTEPSRRPPIPPRPAEPYAYRDRPPPQPDRRPNPARSLRSEPRLD